VLSDDMTGGVASHEARLGFNPFQLAPEQQPEGIVGKEGRKLEAGRAGVEHDNQIGHNSSLPGICRGSG
jgi:hypothetical protein